MDRISRQDVEYWFKVIRWETTGSKLMKEGVISRIATCASNAVARLSMMSVHSDAVRVYSLRGLFPVFDYYITKDGSS